MKFHKLIINNFLGIGHIEIEFNYNGLVMIEGVNKDSPISTSNGASKSSIPEAILWCLFGTTKRGLKGDDVVNRSVGVDCFVEVWFDSYRIRRSRAGSDGNTLSVFCEDRELTKGTTQQTQELIEEIIKRGRAAFEKLFHFGQGDTQPIASMSDAVLKAIFEQSFNLGFINDCLLKIKDAEKEVSSELTKLHGVIVSNDTYIRRADEYLQMLIQNRDKFEKEKQEEIARYRSLIAEYHGQLTSISCLVKDYNDEYFEQELRLIEANINNAKDALNKAEVDVAKAKLEYNSVIKEATKYRDSLVEVHNQKAKAESKVGTPCPSCRKTIQRDDVDGVIQGYTTQIQTLERDIRRHKNAIEGAKLALDEKQKGIESLRDALNNAVISGKTGDEIYRRYEEFRAAQIEAGKVKLLIQEYENLLKAAEAKRNSFPDEIAKVEKEKKEKLGETTSLTKEAKAKELKAHSLEALADIFGNSGLKSYIFDSVTPRLNELINSYLKRLDDIQVEFSTQKQLKSGELREKFDIIVNTANGQSSFDALSGGEKQRVSLAISLAMNKMMREIAGDPLNILFLDEVAESLDESSAEAVYGLINDFAGDVDNIFVISHNQALKDIIPTVLTVIKENGIARLG